MLPLKKKYFISFLLFATQPALAGPPFITDDPSPVSYHHANIYLFSTVDRTQNSQLLTFPAIQVDYGLANNLEITTTIPYVFQTSFVQGIPSTKGKGDIQIGFKYAFIQETNNMPQVAFAPAYSIPTGNVNRGLGNGKSQLVLPIWIQKSWNLWTSYGGGGYSLNAASQMKNAFFGGCVLQRQINEKLMLGGEIFTQGAVSTTTNSYTLLGVGGIYSITPTLSTLFSIGHSIIGMEHWVGYLSIAASL